MTQNRNPDGVWKEEQQGKKVTRENWKSRWQTDDTSDLKLKDGESCVFICLSLDSWKGLKCQRQILTICRENDWRSVFWNFRLQAGSECHFCRCGNFAKKKNIVVLYWHELQLTFIHWESRDLLTLKTIKNMLTVHAFILTPHGPKYVDTQTQVWSCFSKTIDLSPLLQTQVHPWCPALTLGDRAHALHSWWWMWCGTSAKPNWETFIMAQVCAWRRCCCSETGRGLPQAAHDCWKYYCML